ncbi:MAG TPA: ABC transporter ATP-binding protein/permease [Candidatus Borkfalkia stercoripullorum]|nr:ABC transporter ATP-binding protein/permease [Candidatus Borkfalkia stercoripullorum]
MTQRNTYFQDEVVKEEKIDVKNLRRLLKYVVPHKKMFCIVLALMLVAVASSLISPLILKGIINQAIPNRDHAQLALALGGIAVCGLIEIFITYFQQKKMGRMGHGLIADIRRDIFYKLQTLPFDYFDNRPAGKIAVRVTDYIGELADFFTNYLMNFILNIVRIVVVTVFMLVQSWMLTLVVYSAVIPLTAGVIFIRYLIRKLFRHHRAKVSNRAAFIVESIMGENIIQNYNRTKYNEQIYHDLQQDSAKTWMKIVRRNELNTPVVETFWNYGTVMLYAVAFLAIPLGYFTDGPGTVIVFSSYMTLFFGPLVQLSVIIQNLAQVSANLERIFETIDTPAGIEDKSDSVELKNVKGKIDYNDVTFSYEEGINILEHFDLHVTPGERIALVGPTGAGKTTVINLLTRFYDVKAGSVTIDGTDVRDIKLRSLRKEVGVLMQDPFIFKGTVLENIRYGRPDATDEECIAAAKAIFADKCIERLPGGYNEELAERGEGLSAGEKQLISFARIIVKNPSVIILDEATSSISSDMEKLIQSALEVILKGRTSFIVAHRLSTIRNSDRILFIANKGIAEEGSHDQLMAKKGLYYNLNKNLNKE